MNHGILRWYKKLYKGPEASRIKTRFHLRFLSKGKADNLYLITLPNNDKTLLDISPMSYLRQKGMRHYLKSYPLYVVGIAKGRGEAFELVRTIVDEVYSKTQAFDIPAYLDFGKDREVAQ